MCRFYRYTLLRVSLVKVWRRRSIFSCRQYAIFASASWDRLAFNIDSGPLFPQNPRSCHY